MTKYLLTLLILISSIVLSPIQYCFADSSAPYSTNIGMPWWAILIIVLACVGTIALIIFLIIDHHKKRH